MEFNPVKNKIYFVIASCSDAHVMKQIRRELPGIFIISSIYPKIDENAKVDILIEGAEEIKNPVIFYIDSDEYKAKHKMQEIMGMFNKSFDLSYNAFMYYRDYTEANNVFTNFNTEANMIFKAEHLFVNNLNNEKK